MRKRRRERRKVEGEGGKGGRGKEDKDEDKVTGESPEKVSLMCDWGRRTVCMGGTGNSTWNFLISTTELKAYSVKGRAINTAPLGHWRKPTVRGVRERKNHFRKGRNIFWAQNQRWNECQREGYTSGTQRGSAYQRLRFHRHSGECSSAWQPPG